MSFCVNVLINQKLLHIPTKASEIQELTLGLHRLKSLANIYEVSITKDFVIVTTQDTVKEESDLLKAHPEVRTNIDAYDWECNHLWNITDIIGHTDMHIGGGTVSSKELLKDYPGFDESKCDDKSELYCCTANSRLFVINLSTRKVIQVLETR